MKHSVYNDIGVGRDFAVFNDSDLTMEEVTGEDLKPVRIEEGSPFASAAWSCNCSWYFIITDDAIMLFNVYTNRGYLCRKKSAMFIELFLSAPHKSAGKRSGKRQRT